MNKKLNIVYWKEKSFGLVNCWNIPKLWLRAKP